MNTSVRYLFLVFCIILYTVSGFAQKKNIKREYYEDGTLKGEGIYGNYVYMNPRIGALKHPETKCKKKMGYD